VGSAIPVTSPEGRRPGGSPARQPPARRGTGLAAAGLGRAAGAAARAPFSRRTHRDLLFCLISVPLAIAGFTGTVLLLVPGVVLSISIVGTMLGLPLIVFASSAAGEVAGLNRRLAGWLLGVRVAEPPAFRPGHGVLSRLDARLRDGTAWRAVAYVLLKLPAAALEGFSVYVAAAGLADLTYPLWWPLFRNHPAGTRLSPVGVLNPLTAGNGMLFRISSYPGTFAAFAVGAAAVLAAPWVARAAVGVDRRLIRALLGPRRLEERVRQLEQTRARAVDDSAAQLRQVERDLHDGAQVRLAALAMSLGMAREKLGDGDQRADLASIRELVESAHRGAKDALSELRDLVKGIHPPVLDSGLPDALATLAAASALPVELRADVPVRPSEAIETIAYFCTAELLANATKHSSANLVVIRAAVQGPGPEPRLVLQVGDDGTGGADPARGSGLAGLVQRVAVVDGRLAIVSPPGGPTLITVELPLRA
jgi:signal transduction histidine kinase